MKSLYTVKQMKDPELSPDLPTSHLEDWANVIAFVSSVPRKQNEWDKWLVSSLGGAKQVGLHVLHANFTGKSYPHIQMYHYIILKSLMIVFLCVLEMDNYVTHFLPSCLVIKKLQAGSSAHRPLLCYPNYLLRFSFIPCKRFISSFCFFIH